MAYTPATEKLIRALQTLPGVGTRSAQRMALQLLERDTASAQLLVNSLQDALNKVKKCPSCRTLTEEDVCSICADDTRDHATICVVANDADKAGIEMAASFSGIYYVLHGTLSPIDAVGPQELGILDLMERVSQGSVSEIVLALDEQLESEATVHYISEQIKQSEVQVTRVQFQNMKSGSLDKVESHVIEKALAGKQTIGFEHD